MRHGLIATLIAALTLTAPSAATAQMGAVAPWPEQKVDGWLRWRGPLQSGVSLEKGLPNQIDGERPAWTFEMRGRGAPVIADGRVFAMAYEGEGADLEEAIVCLEERTGRLLWEHRFSDFLSDVIYNRYAISSPTIDPETGTVYCMTTPGLLCAFDPKSGEMLWQIPMAEEYGRLTYPNGRTLGPIVDGQFVIVHNMTSSWGPLGPARDRFFAFDKDTGDHVWTSTPGGPPKDSPYSHPVFEWRDGRRMLYAGTAGGNMVAVDVLTGEPVWRYQMSIGGVCASPLLYGDNLIAVHGKENLDSSNAGRMISIRLGARTNPDGSQRVLSRDHENWRNNEPTSFTSSPVLADGVVYNTIFSGELFAIDANSGRLLWTEKLGSDQIHASPAFADGKLYVPMNDGSFYVIRPSREGPEILSKTELEGNCLGAPSIWNGRIYVHTTEKLYCFQDGAIDGRDEVPAERRPRVSRATSLRIMPADISVMPGETVSFTAQEIDEAGLIVSESVASLSWTANPLGLDVSSDGKTVTAPSRPGAAVLTATSGDLKGSVRFRVTYPTEFTEDFESVALNAGPENARFGRPPGFWISGFPKWDVAEQDGSKVLRKTLSNAIFQRTMGFFGDSRQTNYTMQADIMSEGNRRTMSAAGLVNQRYLIALKGNQRTLEISSNFERIKHTVPFRMRPGTWYTLKTRVDVDEFGAATIWAKAWPRDEQEPEAWTASFTHTNGHTEGAPGIYGFAPQSRFPVYVDNITVTPND